MKTQIKYNNKTYQIDLSKPIDISIPLQDNKNNVSAWYVDPPKFTPVMENGFVGDVNLGGAVNFRNIFFNPHGNGTHTECVGHISKESYTINQCLKEFFFLAQIVTIKPEIIDDDHIITQKQIKKVWKDNNSKAFVIRTLPNNNQKLSQQYSNTNPTYMDAEAVNFLIKKGIDHLLIDTPSIDREEDGGALIAHHTFWEYPNHTQTQRTITELVYLDDHIADGEYFLNLQIASFENDASPSKPILYQLTTD